MIGFDEIKSFYADRIRRNPSHLEFMLKEYLHYRMLDIIFPGEYASKLSFIGGTNLRILHHIQRFSEDLDFVIIPTQELRRRLKNSLIRYRSGEYIELRL